jgi:hypothetical protein
MDIKVTLRDSQLVHDALAEIGRQAPFAMAKTLNATANAAQTAVRLGLTKKQAFTLRRPDFVLRTIYRQPGHDFATKANLRAAVRVHPERDFLAQHEEAGRKVPTSGRSVAIPLEAVKPSEGSVVPRRLRPSALRSNAQVRRITTPSGDYLVRNVRGRGRGGLRGWRTEFLYRLQPSVPLRGRLGFVRTASDTIDARFVGIALVEIDELLQP